MLRNQDKKPMGQAVNWKNEIGMIAGPFLPSDTKQSWLGRAARKCGVGLRHIQSLYYGQTTDPKYSVAASVLEASRKASIEAARVDAATLAEKFESVAGGMLNADKDFYSSDASALINAARLLRSMDSARD